LQLGWLKGEPIRFIHGHHARRSVSFDTDVDYRIVDLGHLTPCGSGCARDAAITVVSGVTETVAARRYWHIDSRTNTTSARSVMA
jgi:hypothetical protein